MPKTTKDRITTKKLDPRKSISRARKTISQRKVWKLSIAKKEYAWSDSMDRISILREGLPYESIEVLSNQTNLPIKIFLNLFGIAQTTYNKKKRENDILNGRDSEIILVLSELLDFGFSVFNNEKEKFLRWLSKPNISLGGVTPTSLFDSLTGIQEVKNCLNRIEFGNLA